MKCFFDADPDAVFVRVTGIDRVVPPPRYRSLRVVSTRDLNYIGKHIMMIVFNKAPVKSSTN